MRYERHTEIENLTVNQMSFPQAWVIISIKMRLLRSWRGRFLAEEEEWCRSKRKTEASRVVIAFPITLSIRLAVGLKLSWVRSERKAWCCGQKSGQGERSWEDRGCLVKMETNIRSWSPIRQFFESLDKKLIWIGWLGCGKCEGGRRTWDLLPSGAAKEHRCCSVPVQCLNPKPALVQ